MTSQDVTVLFGSQTGNANMVAANAIEVAKANGLKAVLFDMDEFDVEQLAATQKLLLVTSTYGEGEMPDNAQTLWEAVSQDDAIDLNKLSFSVLALGDTSYDEFCAAGKLWDQRLEALGGKRLCDRVDCGVDYDDAAEAWVERSIGLITGKAVASSAATVKPTYHRDNPFAATLSVKKKLSGDNSSKEIMHYEIALDGLDLSYETGDALNIVGVNQPELVDQLLTHFNADRQECLLWKNVNHNIVKLVSRLLDIRSPSKQLVALVAERNGDAELNRLLSNADNEAITDFLWGVDSLDLLTGYPCDISLEEFCQTCTPLTARAYSISSSIDAHPGEVHLTVSSVRYHSNGREHHGVCSTYLADRLEQGEKVYGYFSPNKAFSVPADDSLPMIMVGPGTGIAPFRAFLEERQQRGAGGDNWLFFGDRNAACDFIYQDELEAMQSSGLLTRLDLAFSRDQEAKVYVQDRMHERGAELFAWLERGAYFFVCGDAIRMAKDVDRALHELIAKHGNLSDEQATHYVNDLKKQKRYVRDVY